MLKIGIALMLVFAWIISSSAASETDSLWLEYTTDVLGDGFSGKIVLFVETNEESFPVPMMPGTVALNIYHGDKLLGTKEFVITIDDIERNERTFAYADYNWYAFRIPRIPFSEFADNKLDPIIWHVEAIYEPDPDWTTYDSIMNNERTISSVSAVIA